MSNLFEAFHNQTQPIPGVTTSGMPRFFHHGYDGGPRWEVVEWDSRGRPCNVRYERQIREEGWTRDDVNKWIQDNPDWRTSSAITPPRRYVKARPRRTSHSKTTEEVGQTPMDAAPTSIAQAKDGYFVDDDDDDV